MNNQSHKSSSSIAGFQVIKQRLLFVLFGMFVFRLGSHIPVPGVDVARLAVLFSQHSNGILGMFNMFSGGALSRLSVFALGVMPYISASIMMQLFTVAVPKFEQLKKESQKKIKPYIPHSNFVITKSVNDMLRTL